HFRWKAASPTASTSSIKVDQENLWLEVDGDRERQADIHATRVVLGGGIDELLDLGEVNDLVELAGDFRPLHAQDRAGEVDVLASRQLTMKPTPTSSREPTRPWISADPLVASVTREKILRSVLFPAPLRPMMPMTSPCSISSETSLSAQSSVPSAAARS